MPADNYTRYPRTILWLCPGGASIIGGEEPDASPRFRVEVEPFYLSKWPITNEQLEAFDPSFERHPLAPGRRDTAVGVSWETATAYCRWYAEVSRKSMRLPTEIEWEHACRAGSAQRYFWGEDPGEADPYLSRLEPATGRLEPAEKKRGNGFGLHGMLGGVWEWTASPYRPYPLDAAQGDGGDEGEARVLRGGSYRLHRGEISCSCRRSAPPTARLDDVGFRVAKSLHG